MLQIIVKYCNQMHIYLRVDPVDLSNLLRGREGGDTHAVGEEQQ